jgi:hypothetical protein
MANETPESKWRNPSYEKNTWKRLTSPRVIESKEKREALINDQFTKNTEIKT